MPNRRMSTPPSDDCHTFRQCGRSIFRQFLLLSAQMTHLLAFRTSVKRHVWLAPLFAIAFVTGCYQNVYGNEYETCDELQAAITQELAELQSCSIDSDCGQVLQGTSCGCTNDLIARKNSDPARLNSLMGRGKELQCNALVSDCSCPPANGFVCTNGTCGWNYTQ